MIDQLPILEKGVELECPKYSFTPPEGLDSKHNLQILSSLLDANNGQADISFDDKNFLYVVPIYYIEQKGDRAVMYTRGTHFNRRGLVFQASSPQEPLPDKTFFNTVGPIEISPLKITFVEEKDLDSDEIVFEDLNMRFSFEEKEGKFFFTASSTKISLYDDLAPVEDIEMVKTEEGTLTFGLNQKGNLSGDPDKYSQLSEYVKKCTAPDGSLNGIRAKGISLTVDGMETENVRVQIGVSV